MVTTHLGSTITSVNVCAEDRDAIPVEPDPRHQAFFGGAAAVAAQELLRCPPGALANA